MPKELYRDTDQGQILSHISFGIEDAASIQQLAQVRVVAHVLYNNTDPQRPPWPYGPLDKRLGTISKESPCETCGNVLNECVGHEGYIELEFPVFHVGFFKNIITILQSICKSCAHVLLPSNEKATYRLKMSNPHLNYLTKKALRKKIIDKCKKIKKCPHCGEVNGTVKKVTNSKGATGSNFMNIVHMKDKPKKQEQPYNKNGDEVSEENINFDCSIILTPIDVMRLFERIPLCDISLLGMDPNRNHPKDLILTRMIVPPVNIRPSVASDLKSGTTEDFLTTRCCVVVQLNNTVENSRVKGVTVTNYQEVWTGLQLVTAHYINAEISGIPPKLKRELPPNCKGVVQRLKGKTGRFRGNLSGKRVDFSSRTVISPDPNLEIDQVGVPEYVACILTYPEYVTKYNIHKLRQLVLNGPDKWPGANYIQQANGFKKFLKYVNRERQAQELKVGDIVMRHLQDDDTVLFNRQPSLHRLSIMSHRVKVHKHRTFRFNECVCNPYNADFDGDEMNLHLPQTEEARAEALILMANKHNLVTPRNGELLIGATQDFLTGAFLLTRRDKFFDEKHAMELAATLLAGNDIQLKIDFPEPCILKPKRLWSGKQIISLIFKPNQQYSVTANLEVKGKHYDAGKKMREFCPSDSYVIIRNSELLAGTLEKVHLGSGGKGSNIFYIILRDFNQDFATKAMWRLARMTSYYLMNIPGFSIGIGDVTPAQNLISKKEKLVRSGYTKCDDLIQRLEEGRLESQPGCTPEETMEASILKALSSIRESAGNACLGELPITNSPLIMALSGSKGSTINISQMIACVGQQALNGKRVPDGFENRSLPHYKLFSKTPQAKGFVKNSFYTGLTPTEFFFHTMGGREGLVDTAVKTATTGYMQRRLVKCLEDLTVHYDNSVRNADKLVVQFLYGCDGLDPIFMEGNDTPVDFNRLLSHIRAKYPYRKENALCPKQIRTATTAFIEEKGLDECNETFRKELIQFMENLAKKVERIERQYGPLEGAVAEIERLTCSQLVSFLENCVQKFIRSKIEPGTAVGALAAQSIGEPGTQMTLKTFHFAGVASMNITQGVPRIMEIINASKSISTPIITTQLKEPHNPFLAREVKGRIEKTTLGQIAKFAKEVANSKAISILIQVDYEIIAALKLEVTIESIRYSILMTPKLKLRPDQVTVKSKTILQIESTADQKAMNFPINHLLLQLPNVIVKGLTSVNRAVIVKEKDTDGNDKYKLCVEGTNLREVMATHDVVGEHTLSNDIYEIYTTLGIEAARETIMKEIQSVMQNHGMSVDYRHIMLLASQMTQTGEVLGYTRQGLEKMKQSVLNLASFEKTADHLFDAAYYGQTDKLNGVSESIIMGIPAPIGSGTFKALYQFSGTNEKSELIPTVYEES